MADMLNCPQCGAPLTSGARNCKYCGRTIATTVSLEKETQSTPQPPQPPQAPQYAQNPAYYAPPPPPPQAQPPFSGSTYLAANIVLTIFCCNVFTIIGIVFGAMATGKRNRGLHDQARSNASVARTMFIIGLIAGIIWTAISLTTGVLPSLAMLLSGS